MIKFVFPRFTETGDILGQNIRQNLKKRGYFRGTWSYLLVIGRNRNKTKTIQLILLWRDTLREKKCPRKVSGLRKKGSYSASKCQCFHEYRGAF